MVNIKKHPEESKEQQNPSKPYEGAQLHHDQLVDTQGNRFFGGKLKLVAVVVVALIVLGGMFFAWSSMTNDKDSPSAEVVFTISGQEFTEDEVEQYLDNLMSFGVERSTAIDSIKEAFVYSKAAEDFSIDVLDEEIAQAIDENGAFNAGMLESDPWVELLGYRLVVEDKIATEIMDTDYAGYLYTFYFGSLVDPFIDELAEESPLPGQGDEDRIEEDRAYAYEKAEEYRQALIDETMTPDEVYQEIMQDEQLHYNYVLPTESGSWTQKFGYNNGVAWEEEVGRGAVIEYIRSLSFINEPTDIQTGKVIFVESEDEYDAYYYFVYLTQEDKKTDDIEKLFTDNGVEILWAQD